MGPGIAGAVSLFLGTPRPKGIIRPGIIHQFWLTEDSHLNGWGFRCCWPRAGQKPPEFKAKVVKIYSAPSKEESQTAAPTEGSQAGGYLECLHTQRKRCVHAAWSSVLGYN